MLGVDDEGTDRETDGGRKTRFLFPHPAYEYTVTRDYGTRGGTRQDKTVSRYWH
jgi:hypothetical protein